ncbi:MAG: hypothetical protein WC855_13345 [Thermodesulfovibrionales bacterium]
MDTWENQFLQRPDDCLLSAKVYSRDVVIKFSSPPKNRIYQSKWTVRRSNIINFSWRSAKRLKFIVRNTQDLWKNLIDLTYPANYPCDGKTTKDHLNVFLQYLRRKGIKYIWRFEFQQRGAPHYHILVSGFVPKEEIAERWYNIVGSGDERHLQAGTSINAIRSLRHLFGYLTNYMLKPEQSIVPHEFMNVGRFWGASRGILVYEAYQRLGHYYRLSRMIKLIRKWNIAHLRGFGIKWKWKGQGFIAYDGVSLVNQIKILNC